MTIINRGSEWRKWDLHIHTPETKLNNNYKCERENNVWEEYCNEIEKSDVSVYGITDYFSIDSFLKFIEIFKKTFPDSKKVFFPNIEFRISDKNKDSEHIQFHVIFSNNQNTVNKIQQFLNSLPLISTDNSTLLHKLCSPEDLKEVTYEKAMVSFENVIDLLSKRFTKDEYLIFGVCSGYGSLRPGKIDTRGGEYAKEIDKKCHAFFGNSKDVDFYLNKSDGRNKYLLPAKPVINGSDCHSFEDLQNKLGKSFIKKDSNDIVCDKSEITWIKADTTFEGLKQIMYEPEERIRIQNDEPDYKDEKNLIDYVTFFSTNNTFTPSKIYLNKNLNVIIGGKSSGKSILLYNIARTLLSDKSIFEKEEILDKYDFRNIDGNFNFNVANKVDFNQTRFGEEKNIIPEIKYIPQNYLIKLAEPDQYKTGNTLNKVIRNLIIEDPDSKEKYDDFITLLKSNDKEIESKIDNYFEIKDKIISLENSLKTKGNKELLEKNISNNQQKINELKKQTGLTEEEIKNYNKLQDDLKLINAEKIGINNDYRKISNFNDESLNIITNLKRQKDILINSLENQYLKTVFNDKYKIIDNLLFDFSESIKEYETEINEEGKKYFKTPNEISKSISENNNEKSKLEKQLEPFRKNLETENIIKGIEKSIEEDRKNLNSFIQLEKELYAFRIELKNMKKNIFKLYRKFYNARDEIINNLKDRVKILEKDGLIINGKVKFNFPKFRKNILQISHGSSKSYNSYEIFNEELDGLSEYSVRNFVKDFYKIFDSIDNSDFILLTRFDKKYAIKTLMTDYFFDYWEIEYKGDKLGKMSTGKASFVILMIIIGLSEAKTPILIDQPEDNLDNRSVSKDLVDYLKKKKTERQIILVTHNPNIVVNADAENIIVANQKGQNEEDEKGSPYHFDYTNGSLENSSQKDKSEKDLLKSMGIREHITDIVEGGEEAFKLREKKYGLS